MKLRKVLSLLFVPLILLAACANFGSEIVLTPVNEDVALSERVRFDDFGYSMAYPQDWTAETRAPLTFIGQLPEDVEKAFSEERPRYAGYVISFDHRPISALVDLGLPAAPTLQDLFTLNQEIFGWAEDSEVIETELFGVPALAIRVRETDYWTQTFMGFSGGDVFLLSFGSPTQEALDTFQPVRDRMLDSIEPTE